MKSGDIVARRGDDTWEWNEMNDRTWEDESVRDAVTPAGRPRLETDDERFDREAREEIDAMTRGWDWQV